MLSGFSVDVDPHPIAIINISARMTNLKNMAVNLSPTYRPEHKHAFEGSIVYEAMERGEFGVGTTHESWSQNGHELSGTTRYLK